MAINRWNDMPAISFKTFGGVVGKPAFNVTIDGNTVVIVEGNQFAQA